MKKKRTWRKDHPGRRSNAKATKRKCSPSESDSEPEPDVPLPSNKTNRASKKKKKITSVESGPGSDSDAPLPTSPKKTKAGSSKSKSKPGRPRKRQTSVSSLDLCDEVSNLLSLALVDGRMLPSLPAKAVAKKVSGEGKRKGTPRRSRMGKVSPKNENSVAGGREVLGWAGLVADLDGVNNDI